MVYQETDPQQAEESNRSSALSIRRINKHFGNTNVLREVDFTLLAGEVHALLGENGAGKSTLMNILTGIYAADSGNITVMGQPADIHSPGDALKLGIGMVHQHFRLVMPFTARENIRLAAGAFEHLRQPSDCDSAISRVVESSGLRAPLDQPVHELSIADQQRIEILKALVLGARILILDEPTAVLTDAESEKLLTLVRDLAGQGYSIVFITHKMREVIRAGDRVSTLRSGVMTLSGADISDVDVTVLTKSMMGDEQSAVHAKLTRDVGECLLHLDSVSVFASRKPAVDTVTLQLHRSEVIGIAGVGGNGQQELASAIIGLTALDSGSLQLDGRDISNDDIESRRAAGIRFIPSDRASLALALNTSVNENLAATAIRTGLLGRFLSSRRVGNYAAGLVQSFEIAGVTGGGNRPIRLLSGGNAQKSVLARELDDSARIIIAHSPTRGLDVAACRYVHGRLLDSANRGCSILLISEDLEEILALSDRVFVMNRGKLLAAAGSNPDRQAIGKLMLGHA